MVPNPKISRSSHRFPNLCKKKMRVSFSTYRSLEPYIRFYERVGLGLSSIHQCTVLLVPWVRQRGLALAMGKESSFLTVWAYKVILTAVGGIIEPISSKFHCSKRTRNTATPAREQYGDGDIYLSWLEKDMVICESGLLALNKCFSVSSDILIFIGARDEKIRFFMYSWVHDSIFGSSL
jgi:hypothetical protein